MDVRNLLIALISKLSSKENSKGYEPQSLSYEEKLEAERAKRNAKVLKDWKNEDWVMPELLDFNRKTKDFYNFSLGKADMSKEIITLRIPKRKTNSLFYSTLGNLSKWKADYEAESKKDVFGKQPEHQKAEKRTKIAQNNKDAWAITLKKTNKDTLSDFLKEPTQRKFFLVDLAISTTK